MTRIERRITPLEPFFDLVFVFAVTQVTGLLAEEATWEGLAHALMILTLPLPRGSRPVRLRNVHTLNARRLATGLACAALVPLAMELPAWATLGILAALVAGSIGYEAIHVAQARARIRHAA